MNIRKEREKEFFVEHMETFRKVNLVDKCNYLSLRLVKVRTSI